MSTPHQPDPNAVAARQGNRRRATALVVILIACTCFAGWYAQGSLHRAAARGDAEAVRRLLDTGWFDVNSPRMFSALLEKHNRTWTPLMYAVEFDHRAAAEALLEHDASAGRTFSGSALRWAVLRGRADVLEALLASPAGRALAAVNGGELLCECARRKEGGRMIRALLQVIPPRDEASWSQVASQVHVRGDSPAMCDILSALIDGGMPLETAMGDGGSSVEEFMAEVCGQ